MRMSVYAVLMTVMLAASAHAGAHEDISQAPPAEPVYEIQPGERPGYYYAPGYWRWDGKRHIWTSSRWIVDRPGYSWVPDSWEQHGTKWHLSKGYWADPATGDEADEAALARVDKEAEKDSVDTADTASKSKVKKPVKRTRKPDYGNKRVWPKISHH